MSRHPHKTSTQADRAQELTDRIIAILETGVKPWERGWSQGHGGSFAPINAVTGNHYQGINILILGMDPRAFETGDPRWATFNQAKAKGWNVRKGEKGTTGFFYKKLRVEDETAEDGSKLIPMLKTFTVFHASQIEGIPPHEKPSLADAPWHKPEAVEIILANSKATIREGGDRAFYSPGTDHIQLPPVKAFTGPAEYGTTALHELGHWTGAPSRLNRDLSGRFGSNAYAMEELRAELASVFVGAELDLPLNVPNHASYLKSWIKALRDDKREIFRAAADAQRIADQLFSYHPALDARLKAEKASREREEAEDAPSAPAASSSPAQAARAALGGRRGDSPRPAP